MGTFKGQWQKKKWSDKNTPLSLLSCYSTNGVRLGLGRLEEMDTFPLVILSLYLFPSILLSLSTWSKKIIMFMSSLPWTTSSFGFVVSWNFLSDLTSKFLVEDATFAATGPSPYFLLPGFELLFSHSHCIC